MDATTVQAERDNLADLSALDEAWAGVTLRFPSRSHVEYAAALLPRLVTEVFNPAGSAQQWGLTLTPGTVRVRDLRQLHDRRRTVRRLWVQPMLEAASVPCQEAAGEFFRGQYAARRARWWANIARAAGAVPQAGAITEWSGKSRLRMVETLAGLDWSPVTEGPAGTRPAMVTLTLPGDWTSIAPTGAEFKRILGAFWKRWDRSPWGPFAGVWKLEFQRRGAPHVHIYCAVPVRRLTAIPRPTPASERRTSSRVTYATFAEWLSWTWFDVCAAAAADRGADPDPRHYRAGTGIDWGEGMRATDPKRIAVYFAGRAIGHNVGKDKEYQHRVPEQWAAQGCGRFWGYKRLDKIEVQVELERHQFVAIKRLMRATVKARGLRVPRSMRGNRGAILLANDGPGWLEQASRHPPVGSASDVCLEWRYLRSVGLVNLRTGEVRRGDRTTGQPRPGARTVATLPDG